MPRFIQARRRLAINGYVSVALLHLLVGSLCCVAQDLPLSLPARVYTAEEALKEIARQAQLSLVAVRLPNEAREVGLKDSTVGDAVRRVASEFGLDACVWRGIVIATGDRLVRPLKERFARCLSQEDAALLLREERELTGSEPEWELLPQAVVALARGVRSQEAYRGVLQAAYWIAGAELGCRLHDLDTAERGATLLTLHPGPFRHCACERHLYVVYPRQVSHDQLPWPTRHYHGPQHDPFLSALAERGALISREELLKRLVAAGRQSEDPFAGDHRLDATVSVEGDAVPVPEVLAGLSQQTEMVLEAPGVQALPNVTVAIREGVVRDVVLILGRLWDRVVVPLADGAGYRFEEPQIALEALPLALPLQVWVYAQMVRAEADIEEDRLSQAVWASLTPEELERLSQRPVAFGELPGAKGHLVSLVRLAFGRAFRAWLSNLPQRDGVIPIWLYEYPDMGEYELRTPGRSEFVSGPVYLRLKCELERAGAALELQPALSQGGAVR